MSQNDRERRDPFEDLVNSGEPVEDLGLTSTPAVLSRRPKKGQRKTPIRPSEQRRRSRQVLVTFSTEAIPQRLRNQAQQWGMIGPDRRSPNVSALVEYLLLARLEAAETGEIPPPNGTEKWSK